MVHGLHCGSAALPGSMVSALLSPPALTVTVRASLSVLVIVRACAGRAETRPSKTRPKSLTLLIRFPSDGRPTRPAQGSSPAKSKLAVHLSDNSARILLRLRPNCAGASPGPSPAGSTFPLILLLQPPAPGANEPIPACRVLDPD